MGKIIRETALTFECEGEKLVGIVSQPAGHACIGVLVLVGGPQYRVGSHRQFLLLARRLAESGYPVMRFDFRGMGDSGGAKIEFTESTPDITAALDTFKAACSSLEKVVLWGLCDAASAALLYLRATSDARIAGIVLLNPWVRSEHTLAATHVKHYYSKRFVEREFWAKLVNGNIDVIRALRGFRETLKTAFTEGRRGGADARHSCAEQYQDQMATALADFAGSVLIILSGADYTAKEFIECARSNPHWHGVTERRNVERIVLTDADHTFSTCVWRDEVETLTIGWLQRSFTGIHK
jgi:exosortase A-associated hydrolase 1